SGRAAKGTWSALVWPRRLGYTTGATTGLRGPTRPRRRGGRVVDRTALEMRHTGNRIGGSNPSLSARNLQSPVPEHAREPTPIDGPNGGSRFRGSCGSRHVRAGAASAVLFHEGHHESYPA